MAQATILGGSANLVADLSLNTEFILTGLDVNGQVLPTINVQLVNGGLLLDSVFFTLPFSAKLNYRNVTINFNRGDFGKTLAVNPQEDDKVCGLNSAVKLEVGTNATQQVVLLQGNNWTIQSTLVVG